MSEFSSFFSPGPCEDKDYEAVRDSPNATACKEFVEKLWQVYKPYKNDPHFLSDAKSQFHQRFWEMYLCVTMLNRGFVVDKTGKVGPEFSTMIGGNKIWFEAIAPFAGNGKDRVEEHQIWTPNEQILMRYTADFSDRDRRFQNYRDRQK